MLNLQVKDAGPLSHYAGFGMETMGTRIRTLREARGWSQSELGDAVGVSKSAVSQWEDDSTKNIKLATFLKLLEALRTDFEYLLYGVERGRTRPSPNAPGRLRGSSVKP